MTSAMERYKAVQVETVEPALSGCWLLVRSLNSRSHPTKSSTTSLRHIQVGKRSNPRKASSAVASSFSPRTLAVYPVGVGPVGLDRHRGEAFVLDQPFGEAARSA